MQNNRFELQSSTSDSPGDLGFKLTGESREQPGKLARVWVRRKRSATRRTWQRYLPPRSASTDWEVRVQETQGSGAMALLPYSDAELQRLAEEYTFPRDPEGRDALLALAGDDLLKAARDWALRVTEPE